MTHLFGNCISLLQQLVVFLCWFLVWGFLGIGVFFRGLDVFGAFKLSSVADDEFEAGGIQLCQEPYLVTRVAPLSPKTH